MLRIGLENLRWIAFNKTDRIIKRNRILSIEYLEIISVIKMMSY